MDREQAWKLLCEYTRSEKLRRHGLAVEACMRAYARKFGEDEEKWALVGLIHDLIMSFTRKPRTTPGREARF